MGCGNSRPAQVTVAHEKRVQKQTINSGDFNNGFLTSTETSVSYADINIAYTSITQNVSAIKCPPNMVPILCMAPEAFPLVVTSQDDESSIKIPIIAMSIKDYGKVICFAHIQMITPSLLEAESTAKFFRNLMKYLVKNESYMAPVLLLETTPRYDNDLMNLFGCIDVSIDKGTFKNKFDRYRIIVITHDIPVTPENAAALHNFINSGGTLLVFYDPKHYGNNNDDEDDEDFPTEIPINRFLITYSLSYTMSSLVPRCNTLQTVKIEAQYSDIRLCNFLQIASYFKELIDDTNVSADKLDEAVTNLRYYVIAADESFGGALRQILSVAMEFLETSKYRDNENLVICPEVTQSIIAVVIQDIYERLPLDMIEANPDVDIYPGDLKNVDLSDQSVTLTICSDSLTSTGLWCPPGKIISVSCCNGTSNASNSSINTMNSNINSNNTNVNNMNLNNINASNNALNEAMVRGISIQIGMHPSQLYTLPGPWHRWPSVVTAFPMLTEESETQVCSAYGGMIYIATNERFLFESPIQMYFTFTGGVAKYPRVVKGNPGVFAATRDISVPWGEIESSCIILTLPAEHILQTKDIVAVLNKLDSIILKVNKFMSYDMFRPYRVVFDVDIVPDEECSYPINMSIEDSQKILSFTESEVTDSLYRMIQDIAYVSIRDQFFDKETEIALSALVAVVVLRSIYPKFNYKETDGIEVPFLFKEFWAIHKKNQKLFMEVLKQSQVQNCTMLDVNEDRWVKFVQDLCRIGRRNFIPIFQNVRPVPRSFTESTMSLPISEILRYTGE